MRSGLNRTFTTSSSPAGPRKRLPFTRIFADAEAIYSYKGSQINTLLVGRAVTGISAFA